MYSADFTGLLFSAFGLTAYNNRASFLFQCAQYQGTTVDYITHKVSLLHKTVNR